MDTQWSCGESFMCCCALPPTAGTLHYTPKCPPVILYDITIIYTQLKVINYESVNSFFRFTKSTFCGMKMMDVEKSVHYQWLFSMSVLLWSLYILLDHYLQFHNCFIGKYCFYIIIPIFWPLITQLTVSEDSLLSFLVILCII